MVIKGKIHQENIAVLGMCEPNERMPKCIKEILLELNSNIDSHNETVLDFTTSFL
jgi:DNA primase large subunit